MSIKGDKNIGGKMARKRNKLSESYGMELAGIWAIGKVMNSDKEEANDI